ncbi:MAG TPA: PAS domain S-box protein [Terriglobales bacterium]|jgi:two-component system cell cycle sensor histidine kinase/response regulator CckA|nr:PAS domain S-box protein [Terriglobales bacterium]
MGEKITPPAASAEVLRAKALRDARERGMPPVLTRISPPSPGNGHSSSHSIDLEKAYLEQIVENAPEAISILDLDINVIRINHEFTRLFGFSSDEATGEAIDTLIVPPDRSAETVWIAESVGQGKKISLEARRRRKDGSLVDVLVSASPVIVDGERVATYASYRDITEQKRAEALNAALYAIANRAHSVEDQHGFFAAIHGIVGQLMDARNFYIALLASDQELLHFPYFVDEHDPAPASKALGRGLTEHVIRNGEPLLATPDVFDELVDRGEAELIGAASLDWLGVPLMGANGCIGALVVQSYSENVRFGERDRDILKFVSQQIATAIEHKRYEEALRFSEARYRSLILSAAYGIYRCTVDGRFLDVNPALIAMLGYGSVEEVLQLDPGRDVFFNPEELERLTEDYRRTGSLNGVEVQWKAKDGHVIVVRLSGRPVSGTEQPAEELEIIAEDITDRRQLEEQFRQAQKMDAVGRLAGGVAHDFNNLLMVINGYTEVLLEELQPESAMHQKVDSIQQAANRAATLTRQLLAFSRKQLLELKVIDVNTVIGDMERLLRPLIGENISLVTRLSPDAGRTRADSGQLEQVIMNLVVNAKDSMPDGGKISIQSSDVMVRPNFREHRFIQPGRYVVLSVCDTGHGMDKETQSRIFEPFFTTKEKGKGTGLGLSTVYGIVKQSGGYVFAQSEPGAGTTFYIYLPRVEEAPESLSPPKSQESEKGGCETVLLVEDEDSVRELVRETLAARGYRVLEAENGERGLRVAEAHGKEIDILITDVVMPGIGGRELAKRLLKLRPSLGVLYLSGYTEDTILHQGALDPGTAFLQKPFTLQNLARKVREVLRLRAN